MPAFCAPSVPPVPTLVRGASGKLRKTMGFSLVEAVFDGTTRRRVMSHSLVGADRPTQRRIVGVALAAAVVFVIVLMAARVGDPDSAVVAANAPPVVKAEKATSWTHRESTGAVR